MSTLPVGQGDLKSLHSELHPVADKWYSLGVQLQIPVETLKCIEAEHNQMNRCLLEMLTVWLKCTNPPSTWNFLTEALESPPVGERLLAQQLRDKYCQRTEESTTHGYQSEGLLSVGLSTPQGTYPQAASSYFMPHPSDPLPWSAPHCYPPPTGYPMSTQLLPSSAAASTATPPTIYSQVTLGPTLVTSSYQHPPQHPVLPPPPPSLISESIPPDTPPSVAPTEHTGSLATQCTNLHIST